MNKTEQLDLANQMLSFLQSAPLGNDLQWVKDLDFLFHFEAERMLLMRQMLLNADFKPEAKFSVLDFGFLHGLVPEFIHRYFPQSTTTIYDRPDSPIFSNRAYLETIAKRGYIELVPCDIQSIAAEGPAFELIILGEIIEHLDPTTVVGVLTKLRQRVKPGGLLLITTPNGAGVYNGYMNITGGDHVQVAPIPDATMGYGHIHLWSQKLLTETARFCGWEFREIGFYHGREGEKFSELKQHPFSLKAQIFIRGLRLMANRVPKLRGFFVAAFGPKS